MQAIIALLVTQVKILYRKFHEWSEAWEAFLPNIVLIVIVNEQAKVDYPAGEAGVGIKGVCGEGQFPALRYL